MNMKNPRVVYHKFTGNMPIVFVDRFDDFGKMIGTPISELEQNTALGTKTDSFCKFMNFKGSPLKFIVFDEGMMSTLYSKRYDGMVDATLASFAGKHKYPMNEKLAMNHALKLAIKHEAKSAYNILRDYYEAEFKSSCPYELKSKVDEGVILEDESDAAKEAKKRGLTSAGWGKWKDKSGNVVAKTVDGKLVDIGQGDEPKQKAKKVKVRKKGSGEDVSGDEVRAAEKGDDDSEDTTSPEVRETLNAPNTTGQDKSVDQEAAANAPNSDFYNEDIDDPDDEQFAEQNKGHELSQTHQMNLNRDAVKGRMPLREVKLLERLINSKLDGTTKRIQHFSSKAGLGQIASQAGELMMQYFASMEPGEILESLEEIEGFLKENGDKSCLNIKWLRAAAANAIALRQHLDAKYGPGNYEITASAWDTPDGVEAMTGRNMHEGDPPDKGYSTDVFFTVTPKNGDVELVEVSLKQGLDAKLFNGGPRSVFEYLKNAKKYYGGPLDPAVSVGPPERKNIVKSASNGALKDSLAIALEMEKTGNFDGIPPKDQDSVVRGLELARKLLAPKKLTAENLAQLLKEEGDKLGSSAQKAIWKIISGVHKSPAARGNKKIQGCIAAAEKIYRDYDKAWFDAYENDEEFRGAVDTMIKEKVPLVEVIRGGEIIIAGDVVIDRATMKEIFGTDDPEKFKENVRAYRPPEYDPGFIGYAAKGTGDPIPIATLRVRPESLGYGNRVKVDLDFHPKFKEHALRAHATVHGGGK